MTIKLYVSPTSPYARKVHLAGLEKGLGDRLEVIHINPLEADLSEIAGNPLGKVPALICEDGTALFDSPLIAEYLDTLTSEPILHPKGGEKRWSTLKAQALGDGILDAAFNSVMEKRRPESEQSSYWLGRWRSVIDRGLVAMSLDLEKDFGDFDIGRITYAAVLGYLDLRFADLDWRRAYPVLGDWYSSIEGRPSMQTVM